MSSVYNQYNVKPVINASGRMTALGVSTPSATVAQRVDFGLNHYFEIKDLVDKTGAYIADMLKVEDAVVVSCASAGLAQSVAAMIVRGDRYRLDNLHAHSHPVPSDIVLPKGHNVNFGAPVGTMITLGGGRVVEAGYANECSAEQLAAAITPNTAAIVYIKSHHCVQKSILSVEQAVSVARQHNLPLIVDAAAEEDLQLYYQLGADLVIYSGAKAIEGPTSGLVLGKKQYINWVKQQSAGIGRAMKVGKEGVLGLTLAIEEYLQREKESGQQMLEKMADFITQLNTLTGVNAKPVWDSAGRDIARTEIGFDPALTGISTPDIVSRMKQHTPAIYCRAYRMNENKIEMDVRSVQQSELAQIFAVIQQILLSVQGA